MSAIWGVRFGDVANMCGYVRDGLEFIEKSAQWGVLAGRVSEQQSEQCEEWTGRFSFGLSLPMVSLDLHGLYERVIADNCSFTALASQMNKAAGGVMHVVKELGSSEWVSLGSSKQMVEVVCEVSDFIGNVEELNQEVAEAVKSPSHARGWLLCIKTAQVLSCVALGVIGITTLFGGESHVNAVITPVGILSLGTAALLLKTASTVYEKVACGPCSNPTHQGL